MSGLFTPEQLTAWIGRGPEWLDRRLTLAGCESWVGQWWSAAAQIGRQWARQFWDRERRPQENLTRLGVKEIRWMSPMEELAYPARAVYDPQERQVLLHRARWEEMDGIQKALGLVLFSREELLGRLLAHECFHHLEETQGWRLDERLAEGKRLPGAMRDVGAHAFSNELFPAAPSQGIDLLWLAARQPQRVMEWLREETG